MRKSDIDMDTVTNVILNNQYDLHEKDSDIDSSINLKNKENTKKYDYENIKEEYDRQKNKNYNQNNYKNLNGKKIKKKKTFKQKFLTFIKVILILIIIFVIFIFLFFKTPLFEKYRDIWVETAMSTMKHQYLAKWFLTDDEINKILAKLEVQNNENSDSNEINFSSATSTGNNIKVEKITGKNYVGYVMTIPRNANISLVDSRNGSRGTKLSQICKNNNAIAGINAGGFVDNDGRGNGNLLCDATIINKKLLYGNKSTRYRFIGLSSDKKLVLGKYTYQEALNTGIVSAVEFGPYLIVNGKKQITNSSSGGIHPRMAIGQKKDGTFLFVVVDGRQPGYSIGTNLLELQNIFSRYDAYNAANLDGGSSATMYYNGKIVNKTSTPIGERYLPNAFIVKQ